MNKDDHCSLTLSERFKLFLSDPAIERELLQVKRPIINVEPLPTSIYYQKQSPKTTSRAQQKRNSSGAAAATSSNKRGKKTLVKKASKIAQMEEKTNPKLDTSMTCKSQQDRNDDDLTNEKLSDLMRCPLCLNVPIYPKECRHCTQIICNTCLLKYERQKTTQKNGIVCCFCKSDDPNSYRPIQSKILQDTIDRIKVGHRCTQYREINSYTVQDLKRHAESGQCQGYLFKCRCDFKSTYDEMRKHLREDCPLVRLQCRYCHMGQDYLPNSCMDIQQMNHFNSHSFTRDQFKSHSCYSEQKKIEESFQCEETLSKIKMLLLQKSTNLIQKSKKEGSVNSQNNQQVNASSNNTLKNHCKNDRCIYGWFDEPAPRYINKVELEIYNPTKVRAKNQNNFECQYCKKNYEYLYQGDQNTCINNRQDVLIRCEKCSLASCKFCLQQENFGLPSEIDEDNQKLTSNDVTIQSILNLVKIKFEKNVQDSSDPYNRYIDQPAEATINRQQEQVDQEQFQDYEGLDDTQRIQALVAQDSIENSDENVYHHQQDERGNLVNQSMDFYRDVGGSISQIQT